MIKSFNPYIEKKTDFISWKYFFIATIILFIILRLPLLESHFFHCDDGAKMPTYPLMTIFFGHFFWTISEVLHYKFFLDIPSFVFENLFSRTFSFILSFVSFWSTLLIIKRLFNDNVITFFIGVIFSTSQMLIIYSIHSSPYGYSMLSVNIMILFILNQNIVWDKRKIILAIGVSIIPFYNIYSIFLLPAFSLVLLLKSKKPIFKITKETYLIITLFVSSITVYFFQIVPLNRDVFDRPLALHWNKGINSQFILSKKNYWHFINHPIETIWFYFKNTMLIIENNIAFYPLKSGIRESTLSIIVGVFVVVVSYFGIKRLNTINRHLLIFSIFSVLTTYILVYFNLISLSPTRHHIWASSFIFIIIASFLKSFSSLRNKLVFTLSGMIIILVLINFKTKFYNKRLAKINYTQLEKLKSKYDIDYFFDYQFSDNVRKYYIKEFKIFLTKLNSNSLKKNLTICLVSHRPIEKDSLLFKNYIEKLENERNKYNYNKQNFFLDNVSSSINFKEEIIFSENVFSKTEVGRTQFCNNGTNGRFVRVLKIYSK